MLWLQAHEKKLAEVEIVKTQQLVEREGAWLASMQQQRHVEGRAGKNTRLLVNKMSRRKKKIKELMAVCQSWQGMLLGGTLL